MKKGLCVLGLACGAMLLTGCGNSVLECTNSDSVDGTMDVLYTVKINHNGTSVKETNMNIEINFTNEAVTEDFLKENKDSLKEIFCDEVESISDSCEMEVKGTKALFDVKVSDKASEYDTKDEAIKYWESEGYTCKK